MTPKEQAKAEWAEIQRRRKALGQDKRPWNTPEAGEAWVEARIRGIEKERA